MLRDRALRLAPEEVGFSRDTDEHSTVFGVILETAHPDVVASLVVLIDGSVSLYVSDGSGCIGCGSHPEIRSVAAELLQLSANALPLSKPTTSHVPPIRGMVRIYWLTLAGLRSAET